MDYQNFIIESLKETSEIARSSLGKVGGVLKDGDSNQVVTETDLKIGKTIVEKIKRKFPDHNIIDEEAGAINNKSNLTWVIDPIDGTSNFAAGSPLYGIMIGLLENDIPIAGGFALPSFSEIYIAGRGKGSYCDGERISVSREKSLKNVLVAYGIDGYPEDPQITREECKLLAGIVLNIRSLRNSGGTFDTAMVARGKYGAHLNRTSKIWDNVAPQIIIEEAGGVYTDFFGNKIDYSNPFQRIQDNFTCLTGSPQLHSQLLDIIRRGE
ncbi:MAG: inositol monophosphatase [Candidatus Pacebacteria bacterium]|nr:inositol monophosphatase [Candidatus Paceibacterota bacterium]